ncbi:MAG: GH92 family glycosyl hydrolase [Clostridia bacterium]|nr:GH92 family glycosyl hydrolase [Clostridia bacterium]
MLYRTPAESVNPYIGTVGHLLTATRPVTALPHSFARVFPTVTPNMTDYYFAEKIASFPVGSLEVSFAPVGCEDPKGAVSHFDMSEVRSHPYSFEAYLEDTDITVKASSAMHSYLYRAEGARVIFVTGKAASFTVCDGCVLAERDEGRGRRSYTHITLSVPAEFEVRGEILAIRIPDGPCEIGASVSYISADKAHEIWRRELEGKDCDALAAESKAAWEELLGRVKIRGGSEEMRTVYYTALYRSFGKMFNYGEYGQYYSGYDRRVHEGDFYTVDQLWDSFRCMHPLQLLLEPERHREMLASYVKMYEQSGAMPSFPSADGDSPVMFGFHASSLFADALAKGIEADYRTAYEGMRRNATEITMLPWVGDRPANELDRCYYEKGFFPALDNGQTEWIADAHDFERRQACAVTLEHAYDDWCVAQVAKALGREDDYALFMRRSKNYRNVYNRETGFMSPRNASGEWIRDFDPMRGGGQGGRAYFAECNAYTFNFSVWHDIEGLAELMGGPDALAGRLDELFTTPAPGKYGFLDQFPDSTGLMGMFCMGNEPSFHIPYFYNYCGKPWMTQRRLRTIIELWFTNSPLGICGDEDSGAMSSWLAFSALGLYPVCPGKPEYALAAPMFDEVTLTVPGGEFTIRAQGAGSGLRYIQSAKLNGRPYDRAFLDHRDLAAGGELVLEMGSRPNKAWGLGR